MKIQLTETDVSAILLAWAKTRPIEWVQDHPGGEKRQFNAVSFPRYGHEFAEIYYAPPESNE